MVLSLQLFLTKHASKLVTGYVLDNHLTIFGNGMYATPQVVSTAEVHEPGVLHAAHALAMHAQQTDGAMRKVASMRTPNPLSRCTACCCVEWVAPSDSCLNPRYSATIAIEIRDEGLVQAKICVSLSPTRLNRCFLLRVQISV